MVQRGATSLDQLRLQAAAIPPAPEFAISAWISSANSIVKSATAQLALPDDSAAEDAFLGFKKAAEYANSLRFQRGLLTAATWQNRRETDPRSSSVPGHVR